MNKFITALVFAAIFSLVGYFVPRAYYEFADPESFYKVESPLSVQPEEVDRCEQITLSGKVISTIAVHAQAQRELVLLDVDGEETVAKFIEEVDLNTTPGEGTFFKRKIEVPCEIDGGIYFFRGRVDFTVHRVGKHVEFYTETFEVKE